MDRDGHLIPAEDRKVATGAIARNLMGRRENVASKKSLNAKNLEALGAARLSELLIEITKGDAAAKRNLRLELAGTLGSGEVAKEIRKRLAAIARSYSFVEWEKLKALTKDLEFQRSAIVVQVSKDNPVEALELMWRFMGLANLVFERCDDGSGTVVGVFHDACHDLGEIAVVANPEPSTLADQAFNALIENDYGQYDYLIKFLSPALGSAGLNHLKQHFVTLSKEPQPKARTEDREVIGYGSGGPIYADEYAERRRKSVVSLALQEIADAQGDVDAFIKQKSKEARSVPTVAAQIAGRLLGAGRAEEAWVAVNAVDEDRRGRIPFEWEQMKIEVLEALRRGEEAQDFRWSCFERSLNGTHLRSYLKRLPDFDDLEAEERAMVHALQYPSVHQSLGFLVSWPTIDQAAELVLTRADELNGDHYELLTPAADALEAKHPLACTLLRRALIDFALMKGRSTRYRHAARHLQECENLADLIEDFGSFETHEAFTNRLKAEHGRKSMFWSLVAA